MWNFLMETLILKDKTGAAAVDHLATLHEDIQPTFIDILIWWLVMSASEVINRVNDGQAQIFCSFNPR